MRSCGVPGLRAAVRELRHRCVKAEQVPQADGKQQATSSFQVSLASRATHWRWQQTTRIFGTNGDTGLL
jgi:hypothetical protein